MIKQNKKDMKVIKKVLAAILANPIFDADAYSTDRNIVSGLVAGSKVSVIRSLGIGDNSLPTLDVSITLDGYKAYGYSGEFLPQDDIIYINGLFYSINSKIDKLRDADRKNTLIFFDELFKTDS